MTKIVKIRLSLVVTYAVLFSFVLVTLVPIIAGCLTAFKPGVIQMASPPVWIFQPTLNNFYTVLVKKQNALNLFNSTIISSLAVLISLLVGIPAAYALTRFHIRGERYLLSWIISLRMIPPVIVILPFFVIFQQLGLYDTHLSLTLTYLSICIPLVIWMMRGYMADIPREIEEAAMVDGCNRLQALIRVVLPTMTTGIVATGLLALIFAWNDYIMAFILTGRRSRTMTVAVAGYITRTRIQWGELFAAEMLIIVPVVIVAILLRKHLVRGFTFGMVSK